MSWLDHFRRCPTPSGDLGNELRAALGSIVRRAMEDEESGEAWAITLQGCSIRGVKVGDWHITAQRVEQSK